MMNRIVFVISFIWIAFVASAQNASEILDKAAQVYEQSQGIKANFSLHTSIPQQGVSESFEGTIQMRGDKFKLETPDMITWYDGSTQWAYVLRTEEVNVSTPGGDELQVTNPAVLLRSYKKGFKVAYRGTSTTRQAKSAYDIVLTPKGKSDIRSVEMQVEKATGFPASFTITDKNDATYSVHISAWQTNANQPDSFFTFNEADYPDAEVVDLR